MWQTILLSMVYLAIFQLTGCKPMAKQQESSGLQGTATTSDTTTRERVTWAFRKTTTAGRPFELKSVPQEISDESTGLAAGIPSGKKLCYKGMNKRIDTFVGNDKKNSEPASTSWEIYFVFSIRSSCTFPEPNFERDLVLKIVNPANTAYLETTWDLLDIRSNMVVGQYFSKNLVDENIYFATKTHKVEGEILGICSQPNFQCQLRKTDDHKLVIDPAS